VKSIARLSLALVVAVLAAACGAAPGSDNASKDKAKPAATANAKPDISKAGDVTLTVYDQEVRGGQNAQMKQLNAAFQQKYPNVTINRVSKAFKDMQQTVKLAVSGSNPPDVVEANQGRPIMGALVTAGLLRPISDYAKVYGWNDRYSPTLLALNSFSQDGKDFGSGELYGLSQMGEIVGLFYNKDKVSTPPKTLDELTQQLQDAKAKGEVGIQFGNVDKWPGIHEYESVLGQTADKQAVRDFVFAKPDASFNNPEFTQAASTLSDWVKQGYFNKGFSGTNDVAALQQFAKGNGRFMIAGTWDAPDLIKAMGDKVGFVPMPGKDPNTPVSLGGESLPFAITSKSKVKDVAAAYIDFLTNAAAGAVLVDTNNLPAMKTDAQPTSGVSKDVAQAWKTLNEKQGLVPYLDYATPTFYDDVSGAIQKLLAEKDKPQAFTQDVQKDYSKFTESTG
jgi:raffinose/stachyose/melibiose transport system substrate-binding protein